ncbi:MAG: (Fe-S)-binding protein [Anaerolineales bacterium]
MLTTPERLLFFLLLITTIYLTARAIQRLIGIIARGRGKPDLRLGLARAWAALAKTVTFSPVLRDRLIPSLLHGFVGWAFIYYLLVNLGDVLEGLIPDYLFLGAGTFGDLYRFGVDVLSVAALISMTGLLIRRFALRAPELTIRESTPLHPKARAGIRRDSAIVGGVILVHVGSRFLGQSFFLAATGTDPWEPFASAVSGLWSGLSETALTVGEHIWWWLAIGTILLFLPYFPYSKHIHLFFAPLNFLLHPERRSMGALDALDFEDESVEQFGVARLEDLSWKGLMDAYACIMCNRCQDACPAYETGKVLSPAALEINKRYFLNQEGSRLAAGGASDQTLLDFAISAEAVWACTACGACVEVCPVGNEPMRDILKIRQNLVLMDNEFPEQLQTAYRGMERTANPWNIPAEERLKWAEGLDIPTIHQNPEPEILWWVGCAPATDARAQRTARAFARVLHEAEVNFAVLGTHENCTGDAARRSGNEYLFYELAGSNVETLNEVNAPRIVATCPHCLHSLKTEYPAFGGEYEVVHHSEYIQELITTGRLRSNGKQVLEDITFHDPCYLGRQNGIVEAPRETLGLVDIELHEMPRNGSGSFCCGAGGAQFWKEEEEGQERVSADRIREAEATGAKTLAVGCPFCMIMLSDASQNGMEIRDVAEIVAERVS